MSVPEHSIGLLDEDLCQQMHSVFTINLALVQAQEKLTHVRINPYG